MMDYLIQPITGVKVKYNGEHWRYFVSARRAASWLAWQAIFEKYPQGYDGSFLGESHAEMRLSALCDCPHDCPIHDRGIGYLARLHKRVARLVLAKFPKELAP